MTLIAFIEVDIECTILLTNQISSVFYMETLPNEYNFLTPFRSPNLSRLGVKKDGGYIRQRFTTKI